MFVYICRFKKIKENMIKQQNNKLIMIIILILHYIC